MLVETCNRVVDATPPLVDGDVEQRALDGDQRLAWVNPCFKLARRLLHISQAPPARVVMRSSYASTWREMPFKYMFGHFLNFIGCLFIR